MIKIIMMFLFSTFLLAQNPKAYSALGDTIYDNVSNIEALKSVKIFSNNPVEIELYVRDVQKTKKLGFKVDKDKKENESKKYLFDLRNLIKRHDLFFKKVDKYFHNAIEKKDNRLFLDMVNSNIIDTKKYKTTIMEYYHTNCNDINVTGIIKEYLDEEELKRLEEEKRRLEEQRRRKARLTKKQIQEAKIKRIRKNDKMQEEALEKELEEKLRQEKLKIRQEQLKELSR